MTVWGGVRKAAGVQLDRLAGHLKRLPVSPTTIGSRGSALAHVIAKGWMHPRHAPIRHAVLELGTMEACFRSLGRGAMLLDRNGFYPLFLLPHYYGPHFDEALARLLLPGRGPFVVHLAVTGVCPCHCEYCYARVGSDVGTDLGDECLFKMAREVGQSGVPLVVLGGGEPLAKFERSVQLTRILRQTSEVRLATSGVGMTRHRAATLRKAGLSVLAVSLDSDNEDLVNKTRGHPQAFHDAVHALQCGVGEGLTTFVTAAVDQTTFATTQDVNRFLALVRSVHPDILVIFLPRFATGRAASRGFRTAKEYAPVAGRIAQAIERGEYRASVFLGMKEVLVGCIGAGRRQLNIDVRGNATACISKASFGNVAEEGFPVVCERFSSSSAQLKRGYFCAWVNQGNGEAVIPAERTTQALDDFYRSHQDALFESLLKRAGKLVRWLAVSGA